MTDRAAIFSAPTAEVDATLECIERDGFVRRVGHGWQITALGAAMIERHEAVEAGRRVQ
jgi:hypothetical protein